MIDDKVEVIVSPGRVVQYSDVLAPGIFRTDGSGNRVMTTPPVLHEKLFQPGETFRIARSELDHLVSCGAVYLPGDHPIVTTVPPAMANEFDEPTPENPKPQTRSKAQ